MHKLSKRKMCKTELQHDLFFNSKGNNSANNQPTETLSVTYHGEAQLQMNICRHDHKKCENLFAGLKDRQKACKP